MKHRGIPPANPEPEDSAAFETRTFDAGHEDRMVRVAPGTLLIVHAVLAALLQIGWTLLPDGTFGLDKASLKSFVIAASLMQGVCILIPTLVIAFGYGITPRILLGRSLPRPGGLLLAIAAGIPAAVLLTGLNNIAAYALAQSGFSFPVPAAAHATSTDPQAFTLVVVMSVVIPAIVEELMFRGLMQGAMEHSGARISAVVLPALAFALFHADPLFLLAPLGAGLLLGYLRATTGSLFTAIVAHMTLNMTMLVMRPLLPQWRDALLASPSVIDSGSLLTLSIVASVIALIAFIPVALAFGSSLYRKSTAPVRISGPQPKPRVFLEWRYLLGCLILAGFLFWFYSFSRSFA